MAHVILHFSGSLDSYGWEATPADRDALNALMAEYVADLGHTVTVGIDTDHSGDSHDWDDNEFDSQFDSEERLAEMMRAAWVYACGQHEPVTSQE
jgi:hypothetical protein